MFLWSFMNFPCNFMSFVFQLGKDVINYIQNELESLEREQKQIDRHAATLEKEIRKVMDTGNAHFHFFSTTVTVVVNYVMHVR